MEDGYILKGIRAQIDKYLGAGPFFCHNDLKEFGAAFVLELF